MEGTNVGRHVAISLTEPDGSSGGVVDIFGEPVKAGTHAVLESVTLPVGRTLRIAVVSPTEGEILAVCDDVSTEADQTRALADRSRQLEKLLYEVVTAMSGLVHTKDPHTGDHEVSVAHIARNIAIEMGLPPEVVEEVSMAGLLHDVGKLQVPEGVLSNPGELSDADYEKVKKHAGFSSDILANIEFPWPIAESVRQHHERLDGSGYPAGLKGDEIGIAARILAVADVVEAMMASRPYRDTPGVDEAIDEVTSHPDLYDTDVAAACARLYGR